MKIQTKATSVLERTSHYLKVGVLKQKPTWYDIVGAYPPHTDLTKKPKVIEAKLQNQDPGESIYAHNAASGFYKTRPSKHDRRQQNNAISRLPKLEFLEDQLRDVFYHQHPWEFSRPKTLVETHGDEVSKCDWATMLQFNKPLDGESVVQRTIWLLAQNKHQQTELSLFEAYDKARFEFYKLRMEEEMNSTVSREESSMYGAVYPSTNIEWGLKQEQEHIDVWADIASEKTKVSQANQGRNDASVGEADDIVDVQKSIWETSFEIEGEKEK
ncbi:mitochondrial ribosome small subunit component [Suhomyces tanzawaensis NRRL Y-17324]|uniref:37S ribosomal protein S25, mitochondrial n=1 Tax=Suhomyces tanzawaensis NRRL Y-17324 TaxID=984487 RepID=A0A1E4SBN0_9ASCO|nr:mitochondrial ribosome small subunit component [Suhomyces tanzawaensis NRRL Y-17324]ODV76901.1 mitochondrial ribosome small subunit component [Suhomyces tanzawaensis NRRL Y-17324]